jgi:hypothetical protein
MVGFRHCFSKRFTTVDNLYDEMDQQF